MLTVRDGTIRISRGDTGWLLLLVCGMEEEGEVRALLTLKKSETDALPLWTKTVTVYEGKIPIRLESADTMLPFGCYCWDVRLIGERNVVTPLPPQLFEIVEVIGDV